MGDKVEGREEKNSTTVLQYYYRESRLQEGVMAVGQKSIRSLPSIQAAPAVRIWTEIDFQQSEWRIPETKNGEPLTVALSQEAVDILQRRQKTTNHKWVFPSDKTEGHLADSKNPWKRILTSATVKFWQAHEHIAPLIVEAIEQTSSIKCNQHLYTAIQALAKKKKMELPTGLIDVRIHDLRRMLGSFQAAAGANQYIIGKSLGHKSQQATAIYARWGLPYRQQALPSAMRGRMRQKAVSLRSRHWHRESIVAGLIMGRIC